MGYFRKKYGKHHYRGADGEVHVVKAGEIIKCQREFLKGAISTFDEMEKSEISDKKMKKVKIADGEVVSASNVEEGKKFKREKNV